MSGIRLILSLIVGVINLCNAQTKTSAITKAQILELQKLPVSQVANLLTKEGWSVEKNQINRLKEYFSYELGYKVDKWEKIAGNQWEGSIFIYYRTGYPNMVIYQTTSLNFTNLKPTYIQSIKEKDFEITIIIRYGLAMEFREYNNENSHKKYSILCYDIGSVKNLVSIAKREPKEEEDLSKETEMGKDKGEKERNERFNLALASGNGYFDRNEFDKAITQYKLARNYLLTGEKEKFADLAVRIQNAEKGKSMSSFEKYKNDADEYFAQKKYRESLLNYENALKMDKGNGFILERINCLRGVLKALDTVKTVQSYRKINPDEYERVKENNYTALNSLIRYAEKSGYLNYAINIKFNDQGVNQSSMKINNISDEKLMFSLSDITVSGIPASQIFFPCISQNIIIPTSDVLKYDLKWKTITVRTMVKKDKIFIPDSMNLNAKNKEIITSYIIEQQLTDGVYNFEILEKKLNDINYEDIRLASFKNSGLVKGLNSLALPGSGTLKLTDGKKGKGRMMFFLLTTAFSIGSKIYSNQQYNNYKDPLSNGNRDKYYNNANISNKAFLISGGIAASIYLYDIVYVIRKGISNKNSNSLKNDLSQGSIPITETFFKPQQ